MVQENKWFREIDIIRGITIFLVVCSHVGMPPSINNILTNFRMPLFFMVSGYLLSAKYFSSLDSLTKKRMKSLLIPYFSASILFYLLLLTFNQSNFNWYNPLLAIVYGNGDDLEILNAVPLWFLTTLFCSTVLFALIFKSIQNLSQIYQFVIFVLLGLGGFFLGQNYELIWNIDIALVASLFLFIGYKFKEKKTLERLKVFDLTSILALIIFLIVYYLNSPVDMNHRIYNNFILFYIGGITGALLVFKISKLLAKSKKITKIFSIMGENSLLILLFHTQFALIIRYGLNMLSINTNFNWIIVSVGSIVLSLLIGEFIQKVPLLAFLFTGKNMNTKKKVFSTKSEQTVR